MFARPIPSPAARRAGFTLVEMLVVIGIIAVLAALLIPAVNMALVRANDAAMSLELANLDKAVEAYKLKLGDYPPSFGENYAPANRAGTILERHLLKCYPKMSTAEKNAFYNLIWDSSANVCRVDQSEALVLWLSATTSDLRQPFTSTTATKNAYFEFDDRRLRDADGDNFPSYVGKFAKDMPYVYIDSRMYVAHAGGTAAQAEGSAVVRPYATDVPRTATPGNAFTLKFANENRFQILCSGQDGEFGSLLTPMTPATNLKQYTSGTNYAAGDMDNLTNFSEGVRLKNKRDQ